MLFRNFAYTFLLLSHNNQKPVFVENLFKIFYDS